MTDLAGMDQDDHGDLETGTEDEDLLDHLISYVDDSPPPTNPASPREVTDPEMDTIEPPFPIYPDDVERHVEDDTDMELEEFDRYPKTEPITSEFTSQIFDNFFTNMMSEEDSESDQDPPSSLISSSYESGKGGFLSDGIEIMKHDCMWAGSCQSDSHQDLFEEFFGTVTVKQEYDDEIDYDITSNHDDSEEAGLAEELDEDSSNVEDIRNAVLGDHSYAFNGVGPVQQHQSSQPAQQQSSSSSSSAQTQHAIHGKSTIFYLFYYHCWQLFIPSLSLRKNSSLSCSRSARVIITNNNNSINMRS